MGHVGEECDQALDAQLVLCDGEVSLTPGFRAPGVQLDDEPE